MLRNNLSATQTLCTMIWFTQLTGCMNGDALDPLASELNFPLTHNIWLSLFLTAQFIWHFTQSLITCKEIWMALSQDCWESSRKILLLISGIMHFWDCLTQAAKCQCTKWNSWETTWIGIPLTCVVQGKTW